MTQRIILFNGPPRSGKDTAAKTCFLAPDLNTYPRVFDRMSMPIKRAFAATIGLPIDRWGNVGHWEARKEEPIPGFGTSYRRWQIDFSECFMKPLYGGDIFGKLFISRAKRQHPDAVIFVPDCGFDIEYKTLAGHFGEENVLVVKIYREGCNFDGDSRKYLRIGSEFPSSWSPDLIDPEQREVIHLSNNGTQDAFEHKVLQTVKEWLNGKS